MAAELPPSPSALPPLTEKQRRFVELRLLGWDTVDAYHKAYPGLKVNDNSRVDAYRLARSPTVSPHLARGRVLTLGLVDAVIADAALDAAAHYAQVHALAMRDLEAAKPAEQGMILEANKTALRIPGVLVDGSRVQVNVDNRRLEIESLASFSLDELRALVEKTAPANPKP